MLKFAALICILISLAAVSRADAFRAPPQSRRRNNAKLSRDAGKGKDVTSAPRVDLRLFDNGRLGAGGGGGRDGNDFSLSASGDDTPAGSGSGFGILAFLKSLFDAYNRILSKHPIATKILSSGIIGGLGDLLIQAININKKGGAVDFRRVAVFTSVCGFYIAPVIDRWFQWLNTLAFPAVLGETGKVLTTLFIDQTLGAVTINAGFFLAFELVRYVLIPYHMQYTLKPPYLIPYTLLRYHLHSSKHLPITYLLPIPPLPAGPTTHPRQGAEDRQRDFDPAVGGAAGARLPLAHTEGLLVLVALRELREL
jgi:hypothetical protein